MTPEVARLLAAQAKADEVVASVATAPEGRLLRVSVTDVETNQRLATGFVSYELAPADPVLRVVS